MFKMADQGATGNQFQSLGNSLVGPAIIVAAIPGSEAGLVTPKGQQPDFIGTIQRAEHIKPHEAGRVLSETHGEEGTELVVLASPAAFARIRESLGETPPSLESPSLEKDGSEAQAPAPPAADD